jgi:hypothetical protein
LRVTNVWRTLEETDVAQNKAEAQFAMDKEMY